MAVDNGKSERQVTQPLGDAQLDLEGDGLGVVVLVGSQLGADVAKDDGSGEVAGSIEIDARQVSRQAEGRVALKLRGDRLQVGAQGQAAVHLLCGADVDGVLGGFKSTQLFPQFIGLVESTVADVLYAAVAGDARLAEVVGVAGVAVADARHVEAVGEGQLLVHALVEQRRVGQGQGGVVIAHGDQVAAQGGYPRRRREVEELIGVDAADLGRGEVESEGEEEKGRGQSMCDF